MNYMTHICTPNISVPDVAMVDALNTNKPPNVGERNMLNWYLNS